MTLREARQKRGWTQMQLAEASGIKQGTISAIERGDVESPSWETVCRLSRALRYRPEEVFPISDAVAT